MGPTLRSSAAPDRSTPWDSDPRADLSLSHNAVGKFACNDEFAIVTGSFCREPPPSGLPYCVGDLVDGLVESSMSPKVCSTVTNRSTGARSWSR